MRFTPSTIVISLLSALGASSALASGYHFGTQSASAQGTANAGAIEATDASVLFYNPAGMTRLKGSHASGVLNIVVPDGKFTDKGSVTALGKSTGGGNGGKFANTTAVPHGYFTHQLSDTLSAGFAAFVPFGSKTKYDSDWAGRYNTIGTELTTLALNPSLAFKLNSKLSLGAGLTAQYMDGKLSKGADFGTGVLNRLASSLPTSQLASLSALVSGNPDYSGRVDVQGTDWGFGFNLGLMYEYDAGTRFGIAYRSKIKHKLEGDAQWQTANAAAAWTATLTPLSPALAAAAANVLTSNYTNSAASLRVDTPESLSVNFYKTHERFAVMGDVTFTRHSRFSELRIDFANTLADSNTPQNWDDTLRASLGLNYLWSDALTLRGGVAIDQSPVNDSNRTPSIPDGDRAWLSGGFNWKFDSKRSVDFALTYVHVKSNSVNSYDNGGLANGVCDSSRNTSSCATIKGNYKLSSVLLGIQYNHEF
jgi:long-chain fatty acid transport protein